MENFKKTAIFLIKLFFTAVLNIFFLFLIIATISGIITVVQNHTIFWSLFHLLYLLGILLLLIYYVNWAIWTKGIVKKIGMGIVMCIIFSIIAHIIIAPDYFKNKTTKTLPAKMSK